MSFRTRAKAYCRKRLAIKPKTVPKIVTEASESASDLAPRQIEVRGAPLALRECRAPEVLVEGPAGTGKTLGILAYIYWLIDTYPGARVLIIRKVKATLAETVLATFERFILPENHPEQGRVNRENRKVYRHINGSVIAVGGLDSPDKLLSSDWDWIYVPEAIEVDVEAFEMLIGRLRGEAIPMELQQIVADCNPGHPKHFLNVRAGKPGRPGSMARLKSRHEDNPRWHDGKGWTEAGKAYIAKLDRMTGARYKRYRLGEWAASEGVIYGEAVEETHWVKGFEPPYNWRRIWVIDFGYDHPFVWWNIVFDEDDRMYRYQEIYKSGLLVEDAAQMILEATKGQPTPEAIVCDHDAEGRATLERHLGMQTTAAIKDVRAGIDAVKSRLKVQPDGKPRLMFMENSLVHDHDERLLEMKKPVCSDDEFAGYEWKPGGNAKGEDTPKKTEDDGMDVMRYGVAYADGLGEDPGFGSTTVVSVQRPRRSFF